MNRFVVPSFADSDFAGGKILWDLFADVATWVHQRRQIDEMDFSKVVHLQPYAIALLVALARHLGDPKLRVVPPNDAVAKDHLIRMGVPGAFGEDWGAAGLRPSNVPLEILYDCPSPGSSFGVASLLAGEFPGGLPAGIVPGIADSIEEVVLNALAHSESPIGCVVVGQASPRNQNIEVAIVDFGITILGHLGRRFESVTTDEQAIQEAVKEGVTGTLPGGTNRLGDPNSGVGLSNLREFVESTASELAVLSGSALVCFGLRTATHTFGGQRFLGTLVNVRFNTSPGVVSPRPKGAVYYI